MFVKGSLNRSILRQSLQGLMAALFLLPLGAQAQISVESAPSADQMAKALSGQGIKTRRPSFKGNGQAAGIFTNPDAVVPFAEGIVISTGKAADLPGPNNNSEVSTFNERGGNKDLTYMAGIRTFDAAILEFDFMPARDSISLRFFYASEGYSERIGSTYDDPIYITISGPGFSGDQNLAFVPGTQTPIHLDHISMNRNKRFYIDNNPFYLNGKPNPERRAQLNPDLLEAIQFDGMTKVIEVGSRVKPKEIYHIRIAIADAGDGNSDSAILLESGSLQSTEQLWRVRKRERIAFVKDSIFQDSVQQALAYAEKMAAIRDSIVQDSLAQLASAENVGMDDSLEQATGEVMEVIPSEESPVETGEAVHAPLEDNRPRSGTIQGAGKPPVKNSQPPGGTGGFNNPVDRPTPRPNFALYRRVPAQTQEESKFLIMFTGDDYFATEADDELVVKIAHYLKANPSQKIGLFAPENSQNADLRYDIIRADLMKAGVEPKRIFRNGFSFLSNVEETMYHSERLELWVR